MSETTGRLYAQSSTYTNPFWGDDAGPSLLINDAVVAMRWYLTHEREEHLSVTGHVSDDDGATWQPLSAAALWADAEAALAQAAQTPGEDAQRTAALLRDALATEAADWLDHRIRYVQPDDPTPYRPETPALAAWERGGNIWALALGATPSQQVLTHLAAMYHAPQTEGPELLRSGARQTLDALALAGDPAAAEPAALLAALAHLDRLAFGIELGQLQARTHDAQNSLLDHLVTRLPATAAVAEAHPDARHPAHQAARAYLHRLSHIGLDGAQHLLQDAQDALTERLATAERASTVSQAADVAGADDGSTQAVAVPGFPQRLPEDLQAAAQWRLQSPVARRAAERAMGHVVQASIALTQARADADPDRPSATFEDQSRHTWLEQELRKLTADHALLTYAGIMADAEEAAGTARKAIAIVVGEEAAAAERVAPRSAAEIVARQDRFRAQIQAAEARIDQTLLEQRRLTRDALHRLFPETRNNTGLHRLRTELLEHTGLGLGAAAYHYAYRRVGETQRTLESLEASYRSQIVDFGRVPVTHEHVEHARTAAQEAKVSFEELRVSHPLTLRALKALDGAATLHPARPDARAARAALIADQSRARAQIAAPPAAGTDPASERTRQAHDPAAHHSQPGIRPT